ncbi:MAG: pilus assembly protein N-terminal domain-containing protein [Myxococcales bacterium]|nr:pilus assembly protein N-terminal domain-containing protein [Myxococcales bacterium]
MRASVFAALAIVAGASAALAAAEIRLVVGEQRVLNVQALARLAVGDPRVADVQVLGDGRQILITAKRVGQTNLIIWNVEGRKDTIPINVVAKDPDVIAIQIRDLLGEIEGVNIRVVGDRVVLDGRVFTQSDVARIERVTELFPNVANFVEIDQTAQRLIIEEINRSLHGNGIVGVRARDVGGSVFLEGDASDAEEGKRAEAIAKAFNANVTNLVSVGTALSRLVLMNAQFVQINRTKLRNLGVNWEDSLTVQVDHTLSYEFSDFFKKGTITDNSGETKIEQFGAVLNFILNKGYGRDLAHPKLIVKSGESARFVSGSSIPIVRQTLTSSSVTFRDVGVILEVEPTVNRDDTITAFVRVEVSSVDQAQTFGGLPAIITTNSSSMISVKNGQTVALSGSLRDTDSKTVEEIPWFGQVPLFGEMFKNRSSNKDVEEVVIFVTPKIITPESEENFELVEGIQRRYQDTGEKLEWSIFD